MNCPYPEILSSEEQGRLANPPCIGDNLSPSRKGGFEIRLYALLIPRIEFAFLSDVPLPFERINSLKLTFLSLKV
jgi:hypothetical protein